MMFGANRNSVALAITLCIAAFVVASSSSYEQRFQVYDRSIVPTFWLQGGRALPQQVLEFTIALKQRNVDVLESLFWAVSDPDSVQYQKYLTKKEILDLVAPLQTDNERVTKWLLSVGLEAADIQSVGDAIVARATVRKVEAIFQTTMYSFVNKETGLTILRQMGPYSVPSCLIDIVELVTGIADFPMDRPSSTKKFGLRSFHDANVVPRTLSTLYNISAYIIADPDISSQCAVEFQGDAAFSMADLQQFVNDTGLAPVTIDHVIGPFDSTWPDTEASLDIQYIVGVGQGAKIWYWTEPKWMYDWGQNFFNADDIPLVASISWGWSEKAQCTIQRDTCNILGVDSKAYVARTNIEFMKIGLRGTTLIAASGDSGAPGRTDEECTGKTLNPIFPGGSPYVTAVGATQLNHPTHTMHDPPHICEQYTCADGGEESAVSYDVAEFASGGGFSFYSPRPSYQDEVVKHYLDSGIKLPPSFMYASGGRGYPDVAALGHNYLCRVSGAYEPVGGTSASAPSIAGIIALLNSEIIKMGGKPIGFANPLLYKMAQEDASTFHDIVTGDNKFTELGPADKCEGFEAAPGWDPVTGLGTPNVGRMIEYIKKHMNWSASAR